jgi:uncharacterized iron-regulated protein
VIHSLRLVLLADEIGVRQHGKGGYTKLGVSKMTDTENAESVVQLVTTRSDAEIAEDLKRRLLETMKPVLAIFDEAAASGLTIQWENLTPSSPRYKHEVKGLKIVKYL